MKSYTAPETLSTKTAHTVRLKFMYGEHTAELETLIGGNVAGADVLAIFRDLTDLSVPIDHELTKKHVIFTEPSDGLPYQYADQIRLVHPTRPDEIIEDMEEAQDYLIGIEIVDYIEREE